MEEKEKAHYVWRMRVGNQFQTLLDIVKETPDPINQLQISQDLCVALAENFGRSVAEKISMLELAKFIIFNYHAPRIRKETDDRNIRDKKFIDEAEEEMK